MTIPAFEYGQEVDSNGNIIQEGSWGVQSNPKTSIPIIIANLHALKDGHIATPATHSHIAEVKLATTTAITLSGLQPIDAVPTVDGDVVLVKNQANPTDNGIYIARATAWTRVAMLSSTITVANGAVNSGKTFLLTTSDPIIIGTTPIVFKSTSDAGYGTGAGIQIVNNLIGLTLTGVPTGAYTNVVVDQYGRVVAGSNPYASVDRGLITGAVDSSYDYGSVV